MSFELDPTCNDTLHWYNPTHAHHDDGRFPFIYLSIASKFVCAMINIITLALLIRIICKLKEIPKNTEAIKAR